MNREDILNKKREREMEAKFGDFSARLVKRPKKNFMWGFGTQVHEDKDYSDDNFFTHGELPTITQLIRFCEVYQMKDIQVVQLKKLGFSQESYAIVASGFSGRHLYSTAKKLVQKLKALECPEIVNYPTVRGRKDDSWLLVGVKDVQVHFLLQEYRYELDLEFRWLNRPPEEMVNKWRVYEKLKKRSDNLDVNEDSFKKAH